LALRDHLVELAEIEKSGKFGDGEYTSIPFANGDSASTKILSDTPVTQEKLITLEDLWAIECLQVRRLRNLNRKYPSEPYSPII
jgi:hypothetical protein